MDLTDLPGSVTPSQGRRRRPRRGRVALILGAALVAVVLGGYSAWSTLGPLVERLTVSDDYEGSGTEPVDVRVAEGDFGSAIGRTLEEAGVVKSAAAFVRAAQADPRSASIQPGTYRLRKEMSGKAALAMLLDPASRQSMRLTVPEGLTAAQVLQLVSERLGVPREELDAAAQDPAALGLPPAAEGRVEGFLFPATYDFPLGATAVEILGAMVQRSTAALDQLGVPQEQRRDVVTKAALVQKEARSPEDMGKVAQVIENRLRIGMPLQMDSTVNYATSGTGITTTAEQRDVDSPYNTYRYPGLPAGPISNPGEEALRAVLEPTPGPWLYFVTVNPETGETKFAETLAEHNRNVEEFRRYLRENPS